MTDAVIFVPGIGRQPFGALSVTEGAALRLLTALRRNSPGDEVFSSELGALTLAPPFERTDVVRIAGGMPGSTQAPIVDVFALDLPAILLEPYQNLGSKTRALKLGWLLLYLGPQLVRLGVRGPKGLYDRFQLLIGAGIYLALLVAFLAMLIVLVAGVVATLPVDLKLPFTPPFGLEDELNSLNDHRGDLLAVAAAITLLMANIPPAWRTQINFGLVMTLVVGNYVTAGARRDAAAGRLAEFIDRLDETGGYQRVHVIAYSIGSVICLDAIFPASATVRSFERVDTLVTIGCMADFLQTYWPNYLLDRQQLGAPKRWFNIFDPADLLASNFLAGDDYAQSVEEARAQSPSSKRVVQSAGIRFRDGEKMRVPDFNVRYSTHSTQGRRGFLISTLKTHRAYWDRTDPLATSVFDVIAQSLAVPAPVESRPLASNGDLAADVQVAL